MHLRMLKVTHALHRVMLRIVRLRHSASLYRGEAGYAADLWCSAQAARLVDTSSMCCWWSPARACSLFAWACRCS